MNSGSHLLVIYIAYVAIARLVMFIKHAGTRAALFAAVNIVGTAYLFYEFSTGVDMSLLRILLAYAAMVSAFYVLLRCFGERKDWRAWLAFAAPIVAMIGIKSSTAVVHHVLQPAFPDIAMPAAFIGISYMAFRLSYLVLEVRNRTASMPSYAEYLSFAFFVPTLAVGPISPYAIFSESFKKNNQSATPIGRSLLRILVGATKFQFLSNIFITISYPMLTDGHNHTLAELVVAMVSYYFFIYFNFSGFCDVAVGMAGLLGLSLKENFDNPFIARDVKEFWNRWHITLSNYMKDVVFAPLSKFLVSRSAPRHVVHATAFGAFIVFLLVGVWHGLEGHYILFGFMHALGVSFNYYCTDWLKRSLGAARFKAFNANPAVVCCSVAFTFVFVTLAFFAFANDFPTMKTIISHLVIG